MSNQSLFEKVKGDAVAQDKGVAHYLSQQAQRAALTRLPRFEQETKDGIALLRKKYERLHTMIAITNLLLMIAIVLGGVLWML